MRIKALALSLGVATALCANWKPSRPDRYSYVPRSAHGKLIMRLLLENY